MPKCIWVISLVLMTLAGCGFFPGPVSAPTMEASTLNTIVAQTAEAAALQTQVSERQTEQAANPTPIPTSTLLVTTTPSEVPSLTPTFIFILASQTSTPKPTSTISQSQSGDFGCQILSQIPANETAFGANVPFEARWQVRNTGAMFWDENSMDYRYVSGDKLHLQSIYDMPKSVASGGLVDIVVDMRSPKKPGYYSTTWRLFIGSRAFCTMKLTIVVK